MGRVARTALGGFILSAVALAGSGAAVVQAAPESAARGIELFAVDAFGARIDPRTSQASISRVLPPALQSKEQEVDTDALRWVVTAAGDQLPLALTLVSTRPGGKTLDRLEDVPLSPAPCPAGVPESRQCAHTELIRASGDEIDVAHPTVRGQALRAEVGGRITAAVEGAEASLAVGGPRRTSVGPIERFRVRLRVRVVRLWPGGAVPIGSDPAGAITRMAHELEVASGLWGQCGIHFGPPEQLDILVVDPPPAHLLAIGCQLGLPASGGSINFRIGSETFRVPAQVGQTPTEVATRVAAEIGRRGLRAEVSVNPPTGMGALRTADVLVRKRDGTLVEIATLDGESLVTDATLGVCLGEVDLSDGLSHFTDFNSASGTVEERSLVKAFDDGDPATVEVFIISSFTQTSRIGESFVFTPQASRFNAVIMDRAGVRIGARSYALAHELGHILLQMPGHPDDYGVDAPYLLMDSDAADGTIFGPRRLLVPECERAVRQSGPGARVPILHPWPLERPAK